MGKACYGQADAGAGRGGGGGGVGVGWKAAQCGFVAAGVGWFCAVLAAVRADGRFSASANYAGKMYRVFSSLQT